MNIHHLELFYYVATYGGISRAVRHMPYGIQQPAVSGQILQLEEELGAKLFVRTPFSLTPPGEELFESIKAFFDSLPELPGRISKANIPRLRIAAAEMVLADYLPLIIARLKKRFPNFRLGLQSANSTDLETLLSSHQIDLAIFPLTKRPPARFKRDLLVSLPLTLLVPAKSGWKTAEELLAHDLEELTLISLPIAERLSWAFQDELKKRRLNWPIGIEAGSLPILAKYVENGYGVGISVSTPDLEHRPKLRALPLSSMAALDLYALWQGELTPLAQALLEEIRAFVKHEWLRHSR